MEKLDESQWEDNWDDDDLQDDFSVQLRYFYYDNNAELN